MTDEQLIDRIRRSLDDEVAGLRPPADLLERLRSRDAARVPRAVRRPSGIGGIGGIGGIMAVLASVAVVAIVVATFMSLGHRQSAPAGAAAVPAGTPAGARALVARMAVLRRAQTARDRLPASVSAELRTGPKGRLPARFPIVPSLTRLAATIDAGAGPLAAVGIYVVVARPPAAPVDIVTTVAVAGRAGHRYLLGIPEVVDGPTALVTGGLTGAAVGSAGSLDGTRGVNVGVVPDGVTRVKWVFRSGGGRAVTVYPTVAGNVAVSAAAGLGVSSATWYGAGGRVVASYNEAAHRSAEAASALATSARQPIAAALTTHFAIFRRPVPPPATLRRLPERTAAMIAQQGHGLNVKQARFVPYPGTPGLWVIPGAHGVSMAQLTRRGGGGAGNNVPVSVALSAGMITTSCCVSRHETVWGLVPDGNRSVTVVLAGGATRSVPVIDNVYSFTVGRRVTVIAKDAAGHRATISAP